MSGPHSADTGMDFCPHFGPMGRCVVGFLGEGGGSSAVVVITTAHMDSHFGCFIALSLKTFLFFPPFNKSHRMPTHGCGERHVLPVPGVETIAAPLKRQKTHPTP